MPKKIKFVVGELELKAELADTETAVAIYDRLPLEAIINRWGDEFYFKVPVEKMHDQTATMKVDIGDIGYWPEGRALAIFFGPTPLSKGEEPAPIDRVNVVGRVLGDAKKLKKVGDEKKIRVEKL